MAPNVYREFRPAPRPAALSRRTDAGFEHCFSLRDFPFESHPKPTPTTSWSPPTRLNIIHMIYIRFLLFSPSSKPTKTTKEHESKHHIPSSRDCSKMPEFPSLGTQPIHHNYSIQIDPKEFPRLFQQFALLTFDFCWEIPEIREALDVLERNLLGEDTLWEVWRICLIRGL